MRSAKADRERNTSLGMGTAIALGPGIGLVFGLLFGQMVFGLFCGAAAGIIVGAILERRHERLRSGP